MSSPTPSSSSTGSSPFAVQCRVRGLKGVKQEHSQWCWAACCEMFVDFHGGLPYSQQEFVMAVMAKEFDKNVCSRPEEFRPTLAKRLPDKEFGVKMFVGNPDEPRFSHEAIKKMLGENRIMMVSSDNHVKIVYGYGTQGSTEKLLTMDPAGGIPQVLTWGSYDSCAWLLWCKRPVAEKPEGKTVGK